jgi:hypothetical protein
MITKRTFSPSESFYGSCSLGKFLMQSILRYRYSFLMCCMSAVCSFDCCGGSVVSCSHVWRPQVQAAVGVVQHGLRPSIPPNAPPLLVEIMQKCWHKTPAARPSFSELVPLLEQLYRQCKDDDVATSHSISRTSGTAEGGKGGGFFSKFRASAKAAQQTT